MRSRLPGHTRLPSYVQVRRLANGDEAFYWVRPQWAAPPAERHGRTCPIDSQPLGTAKGAAITKAEEINATFKSWRVGETRRMATGSVQWLFDWYRRHDRFTKLKFATRKGYRVAMDAFEALPMKNGGAIGERQAKNVDAVVADALYTKARAKHGERQGSYMMQVCRLVWNQAARHHKATGVKDNPFAGMGIKSTAGKGNRAATRAEYDAYRAAAHAMGRGSMAVAAALCFECCQRVWDAFGFIDPDTKIPSRGVAWAGYEPGVVLRLIQSKTGNEVSIPLVDMIDGEVLALYPELEAELARLERRADGGLIVRDERTGEPYSIDYYSKLHARIRKAAALPADLSFTSFRHGGITEIGDSGEADVRAVTGHTTLEVTRIYNKANQEKARRIAARRREHVAAITGGEREAA